MRAAGLRRAFADRVAVDDVTFTVSPGEVVGFLGPNGAGKTTTLRLLLGLLQPDQGAVERPARVGYLPELFAGYDALSAAANLAFWARMKKIGRRDVTAEVDRVLTAAGAEDLGRRPLGRLSRGQRQRVGMAQALLGRPSAYVLDEPTAGLDPAQVVDARHLVRGLADDDGAAVLVSTHVLGEAAAMCDRVIVLVDGRVRAEEPVANAADLEARYLAVVLTAQT